MKPEPLDLEDIANKVLKELSVINCIGNSKGVQYAIKSNIMFFTKQRIRKACEFWLMYKDNPEEFEEEQKKLIKKENVEIYRNPNIVLDKNGDIIDYNDWLFKLVFRSDVK